MPVTPADIAATHQRITFVVKVDGQPCSNVFGVDVSLGASQANAQATVHFTSRPSFAREKRPVEIHAGYHPSRTDLIFRGELSGIEWTYFPGIVTLECRDYLARTQGKWGGGARLYESQEARAVIQNLIEIWGIPSSMTHIEGDDWMLGTAQGVELADGASAWTLISEIDKFNGYRTYTDSAGVVRRGAISGSSGSGARVSFVQGVDGVRIRRKSDVKGIINHAIVWGLQFLGYQIGGPGICEAWADNPFVDDPPRFQGPEERSNLIEDEVTGLAIARRIVALGNRIPEYYEIELLGDPRIQPLMIVGVDYDALELGDIRCRVDHVQHSIRATSFRTTITTLGGAVVDTQTNLPPVAVADVQLFQEAEDSGAGVDRVIVVIADGAASYDPDGTVVTFAWLLAVDAGAVTPTTGTTAVQRALITGAATTLTLTLTVTDADGATGVFGPIDYPLTDSALLVEPLYLAWDDNRIEASTDGEMTWNSDTISGAGPTVTPPFAAAWGTIWGASNGHIYMTIDDLVTPAVDTGAPAGTSVDVTAVWIHEIDDTRAWAVMSDGKVYFGVVDTATPAIAWTLAGTIPASPVYRIREAVGTFGSLRATAGSGYYASENSGATWALLASFSGTAFDMAAGFEQNWASGRNSTTVVAAETGVTPTTPGGVDTLAMTMGWRTQAAYGADDADPANLYATDSTFAAFVDTTDNADDAVNAMIRSGGIDGVVYLAADTGPEKWLPGVTPPWYVRQRAAKRCMALGYGPIRRPRALVDFVFAPYRLTGTIDRWHRYNFGVWTKGLMPQTGWAWLALAAHPYNKLRWLAFGMTGAEFDTYTYTAHLELSGTATLRTSGVSPLWLTEDGGLTWDEVPLPGTGLDPFGGIAAIGWQEQSGRWYALGMTVDVTGSIHTAAFWTGASAADAELTRPTSPLFQDIQWGASGMGGDVVASEADSPGLGTAGRLAYIPSDGTTWHGETWKTNIVSGWNQPHGPLDCLRGGREFWQVNVRTDRGVCYWSDYREQDPASDTGGVETRPNDVDIDAQYLAVGDTHLFVASNEAGAIGFYRRPHATWTPSGAPDYPVSGTVWSVVTDRQTRLLAVGYATIAGVPQFVAHDGRVWTAIALPDAAIGTANAGYGGIYKDLRGTPYAALGEAVLR